MHILITGANGFAGQYLADHIRRTTPDVVIHGTVLHEKPDITKLVSSINRLDLCDRSAVTDLITEIKPDQIYHLAAQAFVPQSFEDPWQTYNNNIQAQLNIIQSCLAIDLAPRILIVSSAEVYGHVAGDDLPIRESTPLRPANPYSVSKATQDLMGLQYFLSHQLPIICVRPFNHIGPRQSDRFVATAFAMQIARIEAGLQQPVLTVGNLSTERDFTDVRDVVRAYQLAMQHGIPGDVYNIASNKSHSIQTLLDILLNYSKHKIEVQINPDLLRPTDVPVIQGDASQLARIAEWHPRIPFEQSLLDILNDCRTRIQPKHQRSIS